MKRLYPIILNLLEQGESFVLASILSNTGSTPRVAGAEMILRVDGSSIGTIGGGMLEAEAQRLGREIFTTKGTLTRVFDLSEADRSGMNMICGGQLEVLLDYMDAADPHMIRIYREIMDSLTLKQNRVLITGLDGSQEDRSSRRCLLNSDGSTIGVFPYPSSWVERLVHETHTRYPKVITLENTRFLAEPICRYGTVYIVGAGHVSQQVAALAARVDFTAVVLDDREEFANKDRFQEAHEIRVLDSYADIFKGYSIDRDSYVVIVTRGHVHDKTVASQALRSDAGYIGMIGSRKKRATIDSALLREGFDQEDLKRIHSPIGLDIGADTPEEIGVSIVAELIKARAALYSNSL